MHTGYRIMRTCFIFLVCVCCMAACEKKQKPEGKLEVTEKNYQLSQFSDNGWAINASGKIKNVGTVDVKRVVVTGICKSCIEVWVPGKWFTYSQNNDIVKSDQKEVENEIGTGDMGESEFDQKDIIGYIAAGEEKPFSFKEFAYFYTQSPNQKPEMPPADQLDVVIESYLVVEK